MSSFTRQRIQQLFDVVPERYELVNRVLTLGLDIYWRKRAAAITGRLPALRILDCCTGTGEFASLLDRRFPQCHLLIAGDFTKGMLSHIKQNEKFNDIQTVLLDAEHLPIQTGTMDLVSISFGVRNINRNPTVFRKCLKEFHRILVEDGRLVLVETSQPVSRLVRGIFHLYVRLVVERIGAAVSGSRYPYRYLSGTIPRFHDATALTSILKKAGFGVVKTYPLTYGVVCVHEAFKPGNYEHTERYLSNHSG